MCSDWSGSYLVPLSRSGSRRAGRVDGALQQRSPTQRELGDLTPSEFGDLSACPISTGTGQLSPERANRFSISRTVVDPTPERSPITRVDSPASRLRRKISRTWRIVTLLVGIHFSGRYPTGKCPNDQVLLPPKCARSLRNPARTILGMPRAITSECRARSNRNGARDRLGIGRPGAQLICIRPPDNQFGSSEVWATAIRR